MRPWVNVVTLSGSLFGSLSLTRTFTVAALPCPVTRVSSTAFGAEFAAAPFRNAKTKVFGVPSVGPSGVLGSASE